MKELKRFVFVVACVSLFSFSSQDKSNKYLIELNIEKNVSNFKQLNICDLTGEITYIPLRNNTIPLNSVILSDFSSNLMLVSDRFVCLLCDFNGNTLAKIGTRGKGPGEYFLIDNVKFGLRDQIIIQSVGDFYIYDLKGKFIRKIKPEVNPAEVRRGGIMRSWALFNDTLFIGQICNDSGKEPFKAIFFDQNGKSRIFLENHIFLNYKQATSNSSNAVASIYKLQNKTYFKESMNDTIFLVNEQFGFQPVYYLNMGRFGLPKEVRELPLMEMTEKRNKYIGISNVYESIQYIFLDCNFRDNSPAKRSEPIVQSNAFGPNGYNWFYTTRVLGVYNKYSKNLVFAQPLKIEDMLNNSGIHNDYDGGPNFYPAKIKNDSTLAMWVDAFELKQHISSRVFKNSVPKYPEKKKELEELAGRLGENDNPVLILCTFKK